MSSIGRKNGVIEVGNRRIGPGCPIFLTAEIGSAHLGKVENAEAMMRAAAAAGCDGADIFMSDPDDFFYCSKFPGQEDIKGVIRELNFTEEEWRYLFDLGKKLDLILYPTPLDYRSIELCRRLKVEMININSDDANNPLLLKRAATLGVPVTMHDINISLTEIAMSVHALQAAGAKEIILLHSTQESGEEATLYGSANLEVINTYRQVFGGLGVMAGCVEHTTSKFLIYAVAALRPVLISKHIQLSEENPHDTTISVNTTDLETMVKQLRYVEMAMGMGMNQLVVDHRGQLSPGAVARRKVLVAARPIPAGKTIEEDDLQAKRPGHLGGLAPMEYINLIGAVAQTDIAPDTPLEFDLFKNIRKAPYKYPPLETFRIATTLDKLQGA